MLRILTALKDINGVVGSFVIGSEGNLLGREMPALYTDEIFSDLGRRVSGVNGALEATQPSGFSEMLLKFDSYWILVRQTARFTLGILMAETVNFAALRMATNVAVKQIDDSVLAGAGTLPSLPAPIPAQAPPPAVAPTPPAPEVKTETRPKRIFRGQVVD